MKHKAAQAFIHRMSDFEKLGLKMDTIQEWEDGMRTDGGKGTFEWWYFDSKMMDGTTLVIVFYTKNMLQVHSLLKPMISITLTSETGETLLDYAIYADDDKFSISRDRCDVRIGKNIFTGDLKDYHIYISSAEFEADITLTSTVPPYRAGTGHAFFQKGAKESYFAWLNAVPQGKVSGTLNMNGFRREISGSGYHDHNWGNAPMPQLLHNWYWGRAEIGEYTVISSYMTSTKAFGHTHAATFLLTYQDKVLAFDPNHVKVSLADIYSDKNTGKPVANQVTYLYKNGKHQYKVTYSRDHDISNTPFIEKVTGYKRLLVKLLRFDGAYLRFAGRVTLEVYENNRLIDMVTDDSAVWELMYLGHAIKQEE